MNAEVSARSPRMSVNTGMQIKRRRGQSNKNPQHIKYPSSVISFPGRIACLEPKPQAMFLWEHGFWGVIGMRTSSRRDAECGLHSSKAGLWRREFHGV